MGKTKYMVSQERLQGTDGIRGRVLKASDREVSGLVPLEAFLSKGVITEQFMELYTYCFVTLLLRRKVVKQGDEMLVGWDPRDKEGIFTDAAVRGIRKAGCCAVILGIIPTPALPVYMAYRGVNAGVMITASHNPPDQNGIKLFLYPPGVKLFPEDEKKLTDIICRTDYNSIKPIKLSGRTKNESRDCLEVFLDFICDSRNSWIENKKILKDGILIVDSANGSYSAIASRAFKKAGFSKVIDVNNNLCGEVNKNCGVSDIDGVPMITPSMVFRDGENTFPRFAENFTLKKIFNTGRAYRNKILKSKAFVSGAVFDADGDRFFMLEYDATRDEVIVLSGDETAFIQGSYLIKNNKTNLKNSYYVNTVESDLQASLSAEKIGFRIKSTGVGDKWILAISMIEVINSFLKFVSAKNNAGIKNRVVRIKKAIANLKNLGSTSAFSIFDIFKDIEILRKAIGENGFREWIGMIPSCFAVGSEESGHNITAGFTEDSKERLQPVFAGNGIKSALNTFISAIDFYSDSDFCYQKYMGFLRHPFKKGVKKTFYVYYTDKNKFSNGCAEWNRIKRFIEKRVAKIFKGRVRFKREIKREEMGLLYFSLIEKKGSTVGAVFIRNSGTEDKTGVSIRGRKEDEKTLLELSEEIAGIMRKILKDYDSLFAKLQIRIVEEIKRNKIIAKASLMNLISQKAWGAQDIIKRVLLETEKREGLIKRVSVADSDEELYSVTERGRKWLG